MIGDTLDEAMDDDETELESDQIVSQVLDEIGVSLTEGLVDVPKQKEEKKDVVNQADKDLENRLNNLK
jgi:charged multivesicular body protein 2A